MTTTRPLSTLSLLMMIASLCSRRAIAFNAAAFLKRSTASNNVRPRTVREMCGLVAAVHDVWSPSTTSKPAQDEEAIFNPDVLHTSSKILHHRGPDGMQIHHSDDFGMGHTRLAIVDPENRKADMPFELEFDDTTIHLAANGEIYNHEQLYADIGDDAYPLLSHSDCEVIGHVYNKYGGPKAVSMLDGMFAFVIFEEVDGEIKQAFAARDPVGIKPLYYGKTKQGSYVFASELKALVGHVDPATVVNVPAGHYWTPEEGLVCYYNPDWLRRNDYAPWEDPDHSVTDEEIRTAFTKAIEKRMMADVDYGFFLSGGIDSCVVAHDLLPLYRKAREAVGDYRPINTYTVGMANSPDVMAAKAMVEALGGDKYINHHVREFTPDEVFDLIPKIVYHMETYEAELIRSAIPNWLLAERASQDVKMVLTGEGSDELFAGYLYFQDAKNATQVQDELRRIYGMLGNINLHRTDRMTMAHGLEARVPFLDTEFTRLVMSVDPARKVVDPEAVQTNSRGREKTLLRELFEGPNENGHSIPRPVLWRAKAMQCEGVGEDWVAILQNKIASLVSDEEMERAHITYPNNTPHTKEELYYRRIFDEHFHGMEHVINLWEGGGRAMGAAWKSDMYTREGLKDVNLLSHSLQEKKVTQRSVPDEPRPLSTAEKAIDESCSAAKAAGHNDFEAMLTSGGDCRSLIDEETGTNKYHIRPQPVDPLHVFRGSCTGNPPTLRGYSAAQGLFDNVFLGLDGEELEQALRDVFEDQRSRLKELLALPAGSEIILCPSGSDAEYIPLAIARTLHPNAEITNGSTQLQEVGAGSAPASVGKYFSTRTPLGGTISETTKHLTGFEGVDGLSVAAREKNGNVVDSSKAMEDFAESAHAQGKFPIVHGVFGGKTGLRDDVMPASEEAGDKSLGVVDACQGRFTLEELRGWLVQDSLVLFTASKFYQAPPFCGAVIIPPTIAEKLRQAPVPEPSHFLGDDGLGGFLTDKEMPASFANWATCLSKEHTNNVGLALRWEAGLVAMEALSSIDDEKRQEAVDEWASSVTDMVSRESFLDPWCVERSIVSIRVAKGDGDGWLDMSELRDLYRWMSMDVSDAVPNASPQEKLALSKPAYIGQPVDVSEDHAIVRIALGVESLISYFSNKNGTLEEDRRVIRKLAAIAKHFEILKRSEVISPLVSVTA